MKYELLKNSNRGVLIDRSTILRDTRDTFKVSFVLPDSGEYLALFSGADNAEYRSSIKGGVCKFPKELLPKDQYVEVIVCKIDGETVLHSWECEPLKVTAFLNLRKSQWQLSGGMDDTDCRDRLVEIERLHDSALGEFVEFRKGMTEAYNELREQIDALKKVKLDYFKIRRG